MTRDPQVDYRQAMDDWLEETDIDRAHQEHQALKMLGLIATLSLALIAAITLFPWNAL